MAALSVKDQEGSKYCWRRKLLSAYTVAYFFLGFLTCLGLPISPPPKLQSEKGLSKICNHLADKNLTLNDDRFQHRAGDFSRSSLRLTTLR